MTDTPHPSAPAERRPCDLGFSTTTAISRACSKIWITRCEASNSLGKHHQRPRIAGACKDFCCDIVYLPQHSMGQQKKEQQRGPT